LEQYLEVRQAGDAAGNGMILRWRFPSGLCIYGLPTPNQYGGEWDLGPTWNYLVEADRPFLVDAGRWGQGGLLVEMLRGLGRAPRELDFVLLSHGHEDHDGGLAEVVQQTDARVKAHAVYSRLVRKYPELAPEGYKRDFPAKCWHCFMPESFYSRNCLAYHHESQARRVEEIGDGRQPLAPGLETLHVPGHSPDALALLAGDEALIVGDTILPGITPWPTGHYLYHQVASVLADEYPEPAAIFGLKRYLRSLKELRALGLAHPDIVVLPAHRLYHGGRFNALDLAARVEELIQHHLNRCADILRILAGGPQDVEAIARAHFEPDKLQGPGIMMAKNEVLCHCELLMEAGDVVRLENKTYAATGSQNFEGLILGS
jgi:glyoxylase-like metal-dependent hydrolase (beta-lactamase superfamily II)